MSPMFRSGVNNLAYTHTHTDPISPRAQEKDGQFARPLLKLHAVPDMSLVSAYRFNANHCKFDGLLRAARGDKGPPRRHAASAYVGAIRGPLRAIKPYIGAPPRNHSTAN